MRSSATRSKDLTNNEIVISAFDHLGGTVNHNKALTSAISQLFTVSVVAATQMVELALRDGVIVVNALGEIRKA